MARQSSDTFLRHSDVQPPPIDHVARALCKSGAREAGLSLLRAAISRDPRGERNAEALLRALEARPDASVAGPDLVLNLDLVDMYLTRGWFAEALSLLEGGKLLSHPEIAERGKWARMMTEVHDDAPARLLEAEKHVANGQGRLGLTIFEQWREQVGALPPWAHDKRELLVRILGEPQDDRDRMAASPTLPLIVRLCADALAKKDFDAVVSAAREHLERQPLDESVRAFSESFKRLRVVPDVPKKKQTKTSRGVAFDAVEQAEFQISMGNFSEAQSIYHSLVKADPDNGERVVRAFDLDIVTHFLGGGTIIPGSIPPPPIPRLSVFPPSTSQAPAANTDVIMRRVILIK